MLKLLKTPVTTAERHGVDISLTMFKKPNPKGLAVILYSLHMIIKGKTTSHKVLLPRQARISGRRSQKGAGEPVGLQRHMANQE